MKFLIDMNLSTEWATYLRQIGFDAFHWSEIGPVDAHDKVIAEHAASYGACIITRDLDFGQLLFDSGAVAPSLVQIRGERVLPSNFGEMLAGALKLHANEIEHGALLTIEASKTRFRVLPIKHQ